MSSNSINKNNNDNNELAVFCPKCEFPFNKNLVACSIHYSYVHTPGEFIYSLSHRTRTEIVYVSKSHSCFECKQKFKKLLDLSKHEALLHTSVTPEFGNASSKPPPTSRSTSR